MDAPPRGQRPLTVGVIGAGRVGPVLGAALAAAGHRLTGVAARSRAGRDRAARLLPGVPVRTWTEIAADAPDLILLAVPDDALADLAPALRTESSPGQVLAHTSGAHGPGVLGGPAFALHPAMTFTGTSADLDRLPGVRYGVTAPGGLRPLATRLVADLGGAPEWIDEAARTQYHAALVHGANHLATLVADASDRLRAAGVGDPGGLLAPLLRAALENALRHGDAAATGPVVRGDAGTVTGHLATLAEVAPELVPAYRALARRTADRALAAGRLRPDQATALLAALGEPRADRPERTADPV